MLRVAAALALSAISLTATVSQGATFYYTGASGGDFFVESNWNSIPTGGGLFPEAGAIDPRVGFTHDLIIDGDMVNAFGPVDPLLPSGFIVLDIGAGGSLTLLAGSNLQVTNDAFNAQFEVSTGGSFTLVDAILGVDDDIFLRGSTSFTGGSVESFADDIEFLNSNITINGTEFNSDDSTIFRAELTPAAGSSIVGATFNSSARIGIREFNVTVTDSHFDVTGDIEDVFATDRDTSTATLTLLGASTLIADQIQEGVRLRLDGSSTATLTNVADSDELTWFTQSSIATIDSPDAQLILLNPQTESSAGKIFNGVTGLAYQADPSTWDPAAWNGTDAATLSITSAPVDPNPDFDGDDDVDGDDFLIWQRGAGLTGQSGNATGDATGDGNVDELDFAAWQALFGDAAATAAAANVPEPAALGIAVAAAASLGAWRRRPHFTGARP